MVRTGGLCPDFAFNFAVSFALFDWWSVEVEGDGGGVVGCVAYPVPANFIVNVGSLACFQFSFPCFFIQFHGFK